LAKVWRSHSRSWDWLFRFWDAIATPPRDQSPLPFGKRTIVDSLKKALDGLTAERSGLTDAHREGKRFVVRADETLTTYRYFLLTNRNATARIRV